jgi:DNA-binding response OmpR family regulator
MNGLEFTQAVKRQAPTLPVVLLTGWGNQGFDRETARGVADAALGKPVGLRDLLTCVDACLRRAEPPRSA